MVQAQAIGEIAALLYDFLPASGNATWRGHRNLGRIAAELGLGSFWSGGSKEPALRQLLMRTLESRPEQFERLIVTIVREGVDRHRGRATAISREQIERLNDLLRLVGFRFPDLADEAFLSLLGRSVVDFARQSARVAAAPAGDRLNKLFAVRDRLFGLHALDDRQEAGRRFESVLQDLFELSDLRPRAPFAIVGEQVDGSIELDGDVYLIEAKWTRDAVPSSALLTFHAKVDARSAFTRGIFISLNGVTDDAKEAITRGRKPCLFVVDGNDLARVLSGAITLRSFLERRRRLLLEEGAVVAPFDRVADP